MVNEANKGSLKEPPPEAPKFNQFREPSKMLPKMPTNSSAVYAIAPGRFFRSRGPFLYLRSENPGRKRPLVAPAMPTLKRRPRGSCGGFLGFPSGRPFLKKPGRKTTKKTSYCPGVPLFRGACLPFFSSSRLRFRWCAFWGPGFSVGSPF